MKSLYRKPRISVKKIKWNMFMSRSAFSSIEELLVPQAFAQPGPSFCDTSVCGCGTTVCGTGFTR